MGDPETLLDLLNYATENCEADNYMLTICGHGASFMGVAHDHNPKDRLIIPEISESLERAEGPGAHIHGYSGMVDKMFFIYLNHHRKPRYL
ncbi:MAG: hypothetical protein HF976_07290 [ANME-2 cluster archaeon]|nr:hypothetical protein [ANME-2 cluster archaeon]MBC2701203.1 hypothetical protein [ANME-2 cluster archaeon]MBC2707134.1 hypothetical protein [ANME-2 cluster archaeon]MBC2747558.1 hypothetical protein [ANME-2 cluster archaeon]